MDAQAPEDLLELVKNEGAEAQISALLKKGASIEDSYAIHCCAYNRSLQQLEMLLRLVPSTEKAVNRPDGCSLLPLMLAAKGACGSLSRDTLLGGAFHSFHHLSSVFFNDGFCMTMELNI